MSSSSPPPPPYPSRSSSRSTPSKNHTSASAPGDKNKERDKQKTDSRAKDSARDGDDAVSIKSRSSSAFSSGTASSTQSTLDTLRLIAGSGVRRSKCRAEFLEKLAKGPDSLAALDKDVAERLSIITGKEGVLFFRKFIGEEPFESGLAGEKEKLWMKKCLADPVVFAVCVVEAGRKVVDYYMTWRGKTRAKELGGPERRESFLDDEFRRVRKEIDESYRRQGSSNDNNDSPHPHKSERRNKSRPSSHKRTAGPQNTIVASSDKSLYISPTERRPSSANDSVISLPYLGAIRNVPLSNRLPLRVTNPDRNSFAGSPVATPHLPANASLETLVETPETAENDPERQNSIDTLVQASDADQNFRLGVPKEMSRKKYAESVSSTGSRSSKSSRPKTHGHSRDDSRSRKNSSSKKHHELSRNKSEGKERGHGHPSSSRQKDKDDDKHSNHRSHRRSSRHHDERSGADKDKSSRKPDRKGSSRHKRPLSSNITVVMVDPDEVDRVSNQEATKYTKQPLASSSKAWHGLTLTRRATKPSPAAVKTLSPWSGPLARASDGVRNITPYNLELESDEEWEDVPGAPKRVPVIPSRNNSSTDSDSSRSSSLRTRNSPPLLEEEDIPSEPETQAIYPRGHNPRASPPANAYTPSLHTIVPRGIPATLQASPYTYGSPSVSHQGLGSTPFVGTVKHPTSHTYTPGYTSSLSLSVTSPMNLNNSNLLHNVGYIPGFIPTHVISSAGSNIATPLPGIHHALTDPALFQGHGGNSPYLYSTPRVSVGSPYVPAWISPHAAVNASLPGSMTPTSVSGVPLHAGAGGYDSAARTTAPY